MICIGRPLLKLPKSVSLCGVSVHTHTNIRAQLREVNLPQQLRPTLLGQQTSNCTQVLLADDCSIGSRM